MKIFISWSGPLSRNLANIFREWLPNIIQAVKPYFSPDDISKGSRWSSEVAKELEESSIGIICLTKDNLVAPWIMFEAGALSKKMEKSKVCPILFGIEPSDVCGPLAQFQVTRFDKDEIYKLVRMINNELGEKTLAISALDSSYSKWWQDLKEKVAVELSKPNTVSGATETKLCGQFSSTFQSDLESASEICLVGVSLKTILQENYDLLMDRVAKGASIKALIRNPEGQTIDMIAKHSSAPIAPENVLENIRLSLQWLYNMHNTGHCSVEVRVLDHHFSIGFIAFDINSPNGKLYVKYYPFQMRQTKQPLLVLSSQDFYWFDFFKDQLTAIWGKGEVWQWKTDVIIKMFNLSNPDDMKLFKTYENSFLSILEDSYAPNFYGRDRHIKRMQNTAVFLAFFNDTHADNLTGGLYITPTGKLSSVVVAPKFRRRGIGRRIVCSSLKLCNHQFTEVEPHNLNAQKFFLSMGFEPVISKATLKTHLKKVPANLLSCSTRQDYLLVYKRNSMSLQNTTHEFLMLEIKV